MEKLVGESFPPSWIELILLVLTNTSYCSILSSFQVTEFSRRSFSQLYFLIALAYWHSLILFAIVFPLLASFVLLCDSHCKQSWDCYLSAHENGMWSSEEIMLVLVRRIAWLGTVEEFKKEVKIFKNGEIWKWEQSKKIHSFIVRLFIIVYQDFLFQTMAIEWMQGKALFNKKIIIKQTFYSYVFWIKLFKLKYLCKLYLSNSTLCFASLNV